MTAKKKPAPVFRVVRGITFQDGRRLEPGEPFDGDAVDVSWLVECGAIEEDG